MGFFGSWLIGFVGEWIRGVADVDGGRFERADEDRMRERMKALAATDGEKRD